MHTTSPLLHARDLRHRFARPHGGREWAVDGISLTVQAGEVVGLLGPNGSGKTTTLRMLAGILPLHGGDIALGGRPQGQDPRTYRSHIGYVPAEAGLIDELTALEAVVAFAELQGVSAGPDRARALLARLGAATYLHARCGGLSTGMKRRVVLAQALVHHPALLLLDEPTDGLDVEGRRAVLSFTAELAQSGTGVILSSHILSEVERICSRLVVVSRGRVMAEGEIAALKASAGGDLEEAFLTWTR